MPNRAWGKVGFVERRGNQLQDQEHKYAKCDDPADSQEKALEAALRKSEEKKKSRGNKARRWFDDGEHLVSALTLLLVVCTTVISGALWLAQQDANQINARILASGERSSVYFGMIRFRPIAQPDGSIKEAILIDIGNSGGSTTRDLEFRLACEPVVGKSDSPFDQVALDKAEVHHLALASKQPPITPQACAYAPSELAITTLARLSIYVFGEATYRDTISPSAVHFVEFCTHLHNFAVRSTISALSEYCPKHNCADDECSE